VPSDLDPGNHHEEFRERARELYDVVGRLDGITDVLRRALPRVIGPRSDHEFRAAVQDLVDNLDETAVHQLNMVVSELWFYRDQAFSVVPETLSARRDAAPPSQSPPTLEEAVAAGDRTSWLSLNTVVDIASYLATAAAGGVIGNRTDKGVVNLIQSACARWRARRSPTDNSLTSDAAVELATAAARIRGFTMEQVSIVSAERQADDSWVVRVRTPQGTLRVKVPAGDPAEAIVVFFEAP